MLLSQLSLTFCETQKGMPLFIAELIITLVLFLLGSTPCDTQQPLQRMEFQEKEAKKD